MLNTLITYLQIFGIGFSFGMSGPCFLVCTPILITYIAGTKKSWGGALRDTFVFLAGRISAYLILGYLAGLSGLILRQFANSNLASFFKPLGGGVSIILGVLVLTIGSRPDSFLCKFTQNKASNFGGLFILGFIVGISPCAPLIALLFEITLRSKSALEGMAYALSFGIGTFISGLIVVGALTGIFAGFASKMLKSKSANLIFRVICALLLILMGIGLILGRYSYSAYRPV